jgi:hypothetical protein
MESALRQAPWFSTFRRMVSHSASGEFWDCFHEEDLASAKTLVSECTEHSTPFTMDARLKTGDDAFRWFELRGTAYRKPASRIKFGSANGSSGEATEMLVFVHDIQARKETESGREQLLKHSEQLASEMAALNELSQALTTRLTLREVLEETYRQASRLVDTGNFFIALYYPEKHEIHFVYDVPESAQDKAELTIVPEGRGFSGYIIKNHVPVLIKEDTVGWMAAHGIAALGAPALSWLGVPMMLGDQVLGVIAVQNYQRNYVYDEHSLELLTAIASSTAIAIQNALMFENQKQAEAELKKRSDQINELIAPMLEAIEQTTALTNEKRQTLEQLSQITQESHEKLQASDENIKQVASSVEDMKKMVGIIGDVSAVVKVLALNAAIEAAHAGRLGQGFAVIAGEIRKLSDSTEGQAQEIAETLGTITQSASASAQASGESLLTSSKTEAITADILQFLDDLAHRMTVLSEGSTKILRLMNESRGS